ncbi:hypothetical protein B0H13DRAFT_2004041 [Mycena leptocephala]|nr:hypothetical protein B0H13DRAFT_2004041 [Mycena leptocephala]
MASSTPKIYVAVVGVGLVGSEFINQLLAMPSVNSPFHLVSLTSTTRTIFNHSNPISSSWKSDLASSADRPDLPKLTQQLSALVSPTQKVALVDNTSSEDVAAMYPEWLNAGFSVITPNKKAFSGDIALYEQIVAASKTGGRFLNEATVGAGLPVIGTLKDLVATGDKVVKIEGVFSGTMSYIFNEFSTGKPDGPAAREKGYTVSISSHFPSHFLNHVHPRNRTRRMTSTDLTLRGSSQFFPELYRILSFFTLPKLQSFASVETKSLIPPELENIPTGDEFIPGSLNSMTTLPRCAQLPARRARYPITHPFATSLGGSDNIIMFHTERYGARPLIVQGAGAGAAVTAMGVLGDLLKLT